MTQHMRKLILLCLLTGVFSAYAQVSVSPPFPGQNDTITVTYNASLGNKQLENLTPPSVYMHAGVITDKSSSATDWKYVQGNWGQADSKVLMTYIGNNTYQKKYHIRNFYGVPSGEIIKRLAFVFRNADGSKVGRTSDGSDIFYDLYDGFALSIQSPAEKVRFANTGEFIDFLAYVSQPSDIHLYVDGVEKTSADTATSIDYLLSFTTSGVHNVKITADNGTSEIADSVQIVITPNRPRTNPSVSMPLGATTLDNQTARFTLYAPYKNYVYVIGDFNNWQVDTNYLMRLSADGNTYWLDVPGLQADKEYAYQYLINGNMSVADPFSTKVLDPWNDSYINSTTYPNLMAYPTGKTTDIVSVFTFNKTPFVWQNNSFSPPAKKDLVVYELLIRDFIAAHDYKSLIDTIPYLKKLGINAIELMPVSEFEGNESWGYNVSFHMALDKYYGNENDFRALVDACHKEGIAVIMDVVYNHAFGQSPLCKMWWDAANSRPSTANPYLNPVAKHPFNVGYDFNHESAATKIWLDRVNKYWIEEFHIDGFRFDLSKGFTQIDYGSDVNAWGSYDASRIALLKRMSDAIRSYKSDAILILEHFAHVVEERELGKYGFLLWGNMNYAFNEAAMGYASDLSYSSYASRGQDEPDWVMYMESHDEERLMYKNLHFGSSSGSYKIQDKSTALDRIELAACFFLGVPGPKMIWQFGELGYDVSIDSNGRVGNKPIRWQYLNDKDRYHLFRVFRELNYLKTEKGLFDTDDFVINLTGMGKTIHLHHDDMEVVVAGNFDVKSLDITMGFATNGTWYDYFSGDSITVESSGEKLFFLPGEYHIYTNKKIDRKDTAVLSVPEINELFALQLYPNPSTGSFAFQSGDKSIALLKIQITDLQGKEITNREWTNIPPNSEVPVSVNLMPGMYWVRFISGDGRTFSFQHVVMSN
ncbi:MAG: DUF4961 domain-containing protein [Bacteroidetes bacterium]|nr:DUF4961 domain-containing protein [Bacteroidota bacterium]